VLKSIFSFLGLSLLFTLSHGAASKPAAKAPSATAGKASAGKSAGPLSASTRPLDQTLVKKYYGDGDFDPAIAILEDFQKTHTNFSREESLMVYKYLGVMYCADNGTREKGKLLKIDPEAKILDMYVSIVVQDIFKSTLDELMGQSGFPGTTKKEDRLSGPESKPGHEAFPNPKDGDQGDKTAALSEKKSHAAYWWIGGLAVAAGVAGGYYLYASSSGSTPPEHDIPVTP